MSATFACSACGRQYPWKPELAGRSAKCKCGQVMTVPATASAPEPEPDLLEFADEPPIPATPVKAKPAAAPVKAAVPAAAKARVTAAAAAPVADSGYRCPSCQADMTPGAPICIGCGFDLRTGKHVQTMVEAEAPAAAAPRKGGARAAATVPGRGKTRKEAEKEARDAEERSKGVKQIVLIGVGALLVIGLIFAASKFFKKDDGAAATGPDAEATQLLKGNDPIEAMAFIDQHSSRTLAVTWTNAQSKNRIEQWYNQLGVKKVWAFQAQISGRVVFELPGDADTRFKIFDWVGDRYEEQQKPRPKDVGQNYLVVDLF